MFLLYPFFLSSFFSSLASLFSCLATSQIVPTTTTTSHNYTPASPRQSTLGGFELTRLNFDGRVRDAFEKKIGAVSDWALFASALSKQVQGGIER